MSKNGTRKVNLKKKIPIPVKEIKGVVSDALKRIKHKINRKAGPARQRLLNELEDPTVLIDNVSDYVTMKVQRQGILYIMGIEAMTNSLAFLIDLIPVPEIGLLGEAITAAGEAAVNAIVWVGPDPLLDTVEHTLMPLLVKAATIFQGVVASFHNPNPPAIRIDHLPMAGRLSDLKDTMIKLNRALQTIATDQELPDKERKKIQNARRIVERALKRFGTQFPKLSPPSDISNISSLARVKTASSGSRKRGKTKKKKKGRRRASGKARRASGKTRRRKRKR